MDPLPLGSSPRTVDKNQSIDLKSNLNEIRNFKTPNRNSSPRVEIINETSKFDSGETKLESTQSTSITKKVKHVSFNLNNFQFMHQELTVPAIHLRRFAENPCVIHPSENLNFFCEDDKKLICQFCLKESHIKHIISNPENSELGEFLLMIKKFSEYKNLLDEMKVMNKTNKFSAINKKFNFLCESLAKLKRLIKHSYNQNCEKIKEIF